MYIPYKTRKTLIYIGVILLIATIIPIAVWGMQKVLEYRSGASPTIKPQEVRVTDITDTSVTISWVTPDINTEGYVIYGTGEKTDKFSRDVRDVKAGSLNKYYTHYVTIDNLSPGTEYVYEIVSGSKKFGDPNGNRFSFKTIPADLVGLYAPNPILGMVDNAQGEAAIVYVNLTEGGVKSNVLSTLTNEEGNWEIDIARARSEDGTQKFSYTQETQVTVVAMGGNKGGGSVIGKVSTPPEKLKITMTLDFETTNLLADSSQIDTDDEGTDINENPGDTDNTPPNDTDEPEETDTTLPSESPRYETVPWTNLPTDTTITQKTAIAGVSIVTGQQSVKTTNVLNTTFTVTWLSNTPVIGKVTYGDSMDNLNKTEYDDRDTSVTQKPYYTHHVTVSGLTNGGTYYFNVVSGEETYKDGTNPYVVNLSTVTGDVPPLKPITGKIVDKGYGDTIVFAYINDPSGAKGKSKIKSTMVNDNGTWTISSISEVYTESGLSYYNIADTDQVVITAETVPDNDSTQILVSEYEELVTLSITAYGASTGTVKNGMRSLSELSDNTPKTGIINNYLTTTILGSFLITTSFLVYNKRQRWEFKILSKTANEPQI